MCTIIKVKRKICDDPAECLIIECKKKKINLDSNESDSFDSIKQILKYAGSAKSEKEIPAKILELNSKLESDTVEKGTKTQNKVKETTSNKVTKEPLKPSNYVMISKKRGLESDDFDSNENNKKESSSTSSDESDNSLKTDGTSKKLKQSTTINNLSNVNIIDVISSEYFKEENKENEKEDLSKQTSGRQNNSEKIACNGVEMIREKIVDPLATSAKSSEYIYDIYYTKSDDIHLDLLYANNFEIKSHNIYKDVELVDDTNNNGHEEYENGEDEDSNDEGNWRNDYPDEDEYDIDEENDEEPDFYGGGSRRQNHHLHGDDDDYDDYSYGYDEEHDHESNKLSSYMKKSCQINQSYNDEESDFDEYGKEDVCKSYNLYKKKILKEFQKDSDSD